MTEVAHVTDISYEITIERIESAAVTYADLEADTKDGYELVRLAIRDCREMRGKIERRRKELKKDALEWGRAVDAAAKELRERIAAIEDPLKRKKGAVDAAKAAEKAEIERRKQEAIEAEKEAEREAERARLAEEMAEQARQRKEAERIAMEATERAEAAEALLRAEREALAEEKRRIAAEEQAKRDAEAAARAVAEREAELKAMAPDAEKLAAYADELLAIEAPSVTSEHAASILAAVARELALITQRLTAPALSIKELS